MNRTFFIITLAFFGVAGCSRKAAPQHHIQTRAEVIQDTANLAAVVKLPAMPDKLSFAGEAVPLEYFDVREGLQKDLLTNAYMHSRTYQTILSKNRYFSIIEPILKKNGIPDDFKYLAVAESGLNPEARSSAGAAGIWQFMQGTAKDYGMLTGSEVDERYNVEKATEAACKHLRSAYNEFGSWTLAAASYNCGIGGLNKRRVIQGTDSYYDTYLPHETLRYVYRILSFKMIMETPDVYGYVFEEGDYYKPLTDYKVVDVSGRDIEWSDVAKTHGTTYKMIRILNPWIRDYSYDNKDNRTFKVKVPVKGFRN